MYTEYLDPSNEECNRINMIAGKYALPFWEAIYEQSGYSKENAERLSGLLYDLLLKGNTGNALELIHGLYILLGISPTFPDELKEIEDTSKYQYDFIQEFIFDYIDIFDEIIEEKNNGVDM